MELNQEENNAVSTTDTGRDGVELDDDTKDVHKRMRASDMPDSEKNTYTISSDSSETTASPHSEDDKDDGDSIGDFEPETPPMSEEEEEDQDVEMTDVASDMPDSSEEIRTKHQVILLRRQPHRAVLTEVKTIRMMEVQIV